MAAVASGTSPGLRPVRHHTIQTALEPLASRGTEEGLQAVEAEDGPLPLLHRGASASRATLWVITPFFAARPKATLAVEWNLPTVEAASGLPDGVPLPRERSR